MVNASNENNPNSNMQIYRETKRVRKTPFGAKNEASHGLIGFHKNPGRFGADEW